MKDLTLEIGKVHDVVIDQTQSTDTGGGQIKRNGRTEAPCSDTENTGCLDSFLTIEGYLRHDEVAGIARDLIVTKINALKPVF